MEEILGTSDPEYGYSKDILWPLLTDFFFCKILNMHIIDR